MEDPVHVVEEIFLRDLRLRIRALEVREARVGDVGFPQGKGSQVFTFAHQFQPFVGNWPQG